MHSTGVRGGGRGEPDGVGQLGQPPAPLGVTRILRRERTRGAGQIALVAPPARGAHARVQARHLARHLVYHVLRPNCVRVDGALGVAVGRPREPVENFGHRAVVEQLWKRSGAGAGRGAHVDEARVEQRRGDGAADAAMRVGGGRRREEAAAARHDVDMLAALVGGDLALGVALHRPRRVELHEGVKGGVRRRAQHRQRVGGEVEVRVEREDAVAAPDGLPGEPPALQVEEVRVGLLDCPRPARRAFVHQAHADARVGAAHTAWAQPPQA
mmetsp:Transcript_9649/g.30649  ORF Transcript_9649/g.30649 Transcript_9649/m.30649 type:complete len:270 (+) Transcript_9649:106-915(+)